MKKRREKEVIGIGKWFIKLKKKEGQMEVTQGKEGLKKTHQAELPETTKT